jgi:predicted porin
MHTNKKILTSVQALAFVVVAVLWLQPAAAQGLLGDEASADKWQSTLFLYLWGMSMDGTTRVAGQEVEVDVPFSDIWDNLDAAFALRFESRKGKWGYFLDGMYARIKPTEQTPAGNIDLDVKSFIGEVGGVYSINPAVESLFGLRYQDMSVDIDFPGPAPTVGSDQDWVDGFVGLRVFPVHNEKWTVWLRGDVGTGDSDFTWNAAIGAGYRFNKRWSAVGAYRILSNDIEEGTFKWDVDYTGLGLAVGYSF